MDVEIIPFDEEYLGEILVMMRRWSPDHPELGAGKVRGRSG